MPSFFTPDQLKPCLLDDVAAGTFAFPLEQGGSPLLIANRSTDNAIWIVPIEGEACFKASSLPYYEGPRRVLTVINSRIAVDPDSAFRPGQDEVEAGDVVVADTWLGLAVENVEWNRIGYVRLTGSHGGQPHVGYRRWQVLAEDTTGDTTELFARDR